VLAYAYWITGAINDEPISLCPPQLGHNQAIQFTPCVYGRRQEHTHKVACGIAVQSDELEAIHALKLRSPTESTYLNYTDAT
jgi:hypothetical protein